MKLHKRFILVFMLFCSVSPVLAENITSGNVDAMAEELVKLRSQVEKLNSELENKKNSYKSRMLMLANQRAELEASLKRENLAIKQQQQSINKNKKLIQEMGSDSHILKPVIIQSIADVKAYVSTSLPFKRNERTAELEKIEQQLSADIIDVEKAVNRLWAFVEDEIRLTKENGIYAQTIVVGDREVLAEVAKLGMILMYFKMPNEAYGYVKHHGESYSYELIHDTDQKKKVAFLFDSLKKQIRQGFFELPNVSFNLVQ